MHFFVASVVVGVVAVVGLVVVVVVVVVGVVAVVAVVGVVPVVGAGFVGGGITVSRSINFTFRFSQTLNTTQHQYNNYAS